MTNTITQKSKFQVLASVKGASKHAFELLPCSVGYINFIQKQKDKNMIYTFDI